MSEQQVKMVILSTDDLDESIRFYTEALGMSLKFRDGAHFAALDGGPVTLALATEVDHPIPGREGPLRRRPRTARGGLRQQGQRDRLLQAAGSLSAQMRAVVV